ncbi:MAG: methyltransferase domain-containing protein [Acidimicrobiia bacterium]|nr:methyltransferase domain-containing protein [Acidimicrobiia bacterium]
MPVSSLPNQLEFMPVLTCRLCGSKSLDVVLGLPDTPFGDRYLQPGEGAKHANLIPLEIVKCTSCNNFQTSVVVNVKSMYEHYLSRPAPVNQTLSAIYRDYAENLDALLGLTRSDLVVEIGSNDGFFSSYFAGKGVQCLGVDPAQNLSTVALERGVRTLSTFFTLHVAEEIKVQNGDAKLIISNMVAANVPDLDDFMSGIKRLLARDGIYALETNYALDVVDNLQLEVINHEHITYFSVTSLDRFLKKHGLEIFFVKRVPSKSGALRCYIQHVGGKFDIKDSVADAINFESNFGLFLPSVWDSVKSSVQHVKNASQKYFEDKEKCQVVGYGTSIGATTILYALDIGHAFSALIDDDPYRQGLESPGHALPIVSKEDALGENSKTRFCAVLAPRYVDQILKNNMSALKSGVTFSRIWPCVEEVPNENWQPAR